MTHQYSSNSSLVGQCPLLYLRVKTYCVTRSRARSRHSGHGGSRHEKGEGGDGGELLRTTGPVFLSTNSWSGWLWDENRRPRYTKDLWEDPSRRRSRDQFGTGFDVWCVFLMWTIQTPVFCAFPTSTETDVLNRKLRCSYGTRRDLT